jgi:hypothetical protein
MQKVVGKLTVQLEDLRSENSCERPVVEAMGRTNTHLGAKVAGQRQRIEVVE